MNRQNHIHLILSMKIDRMIAILYKTYHWEIFLEEIVKSIDMKKLAAPQVYYCGEEGNKGYTGFQVIETSHISFHYWEDTGLLQMDIYSCKDFNPKDVYKVINNCFGNEIEMMRDPIFLNRNPDKEYIKSYSPYLIDYIRAEVGHIFNTPLRDL